MLVLTRKKEQSITIGDPTGTAKVIEVTIVEIRDGQVRIGIKAPRDVPVHRKEVWEQVQQENRAAAASAPASTAELALDRASA